jgi:hypothetical protein
MTSKFEQLIEFVINDEEAKAKELFHDIVVEKSREIYENLMNEESDAEEDDHAERAAEKVKKDIEYDDAKDKKERADESEMEEEESIEEDFGGDSSEDLMKEVEVDQMGEESDAEFDDEAEEAGEEETKDIEADHDAEGSVEDRVVDLEDKLDELMAEFEALLGDEAGEEHSDAEFDMEPVDGEVGGDAYVDDDTSEFQDMPMSENVDLKAAPKPVTTEPAGTNTRSTTAFNSGAAGMASKPVKNTATEANPDGTAAYKAPTSYADKGRGNLPGAGSFKNVPGKDNSKLAPATKPTLTQAAGTNSRTPFPKG